MCLSERVGGPEYCCAVIWGRGRVWRSDGGGEQCNHESIGSVSLQYVNLLFSLCCFPFPAVELLPLRKLLLHMIDSLSFLFVFVFLCFQALYRMMDRLA